MFANWVHAHFIASLLGFKVVPVTALAPVPEPRAATVLHVEAPSDDEISVWTTILLQPTDIWRRNGQLLVLASFKIVAVRGGVSIWAAAKQTSSTSTAIKINTLS